MTSATALQVSIRAALSAAGVHAVFGPADDLPLAPDGRVAQAAVLWPAAGLHQYSRATGTRSGRMDGVNVVCVGATSLDALAVAEAVEAAIGGMGHPGDGSPMRQAVAAGEPTPEPNTDPVRVIYQVQYSTITKG